MIRLLVMAVMGPVAVVAIGYVLAFWRTTLLGLGLAAAGLVLLVVVEMIRQGRAARAARPSPADLDRVQADAVRRVFDPAAGDTYAVVPRPAARSRRTWQQSAVIRARLR